MKSESSFVPAALLPVHAHIAHYRACQSVFTQPNKYYYTLLLTMSTFTDFWNSSSGPYLQGIFSSNTLQSVYPSMTPSLPPNAPLPHLFLTPKVWKMTVSALYTSFDNSWSSRCPKQGCNHFSMATVLQKYLQRFCNTKKVRKIFCASPLPSHLPWNFKASIFPSDFPCCQLATMTEPTWQK